MPTLLQSASPGVELQFVTTSVQTAMKILVQCEETVRVDRLAPCMIGFYIPQ